MENTSSLYDTLVQVLNQHANWLDFRHLKTLAWMMVGLIHSSSISLCAWTPFVVSRAQYSQSTVRRFRRWLANDKIEAQHVEVRSFNRPWWAGLVNGWTWPWIPRCCGTPTVSCACPVIYRGRAIPLVWCVLAHGSATVAYEVYKELLDRAAALLPRACPVVFWPTVALRTRSCWAISRAWAGTFACVSSLATFGCTVLAALRFRLAVSGSPRATRGFGIACGSR